MNTQNQQNIEKTLLTHQSIIDCRVLVKSDDGNRIKPVAFLVTNQPIPSNKLDEYLTERIPDETLPTHYLEITNIPLTKTGETDKEALLNLPIVSNKIIAQWNDQLKSLDALDHCTIVAHDHYKDHNPLHLSKLLPGWQANKIIEEIDEIEFQEGEQSDKLAYSDGGPLLLPPNCAKTLADALLHTAETQPNKGIVFVQNNDIEQFLSYPELLAEARQVVTGLNNTGLKPNDTVILQIPNLRNFFPAFWGCLFAGVIPLNVAIAPIYDSKNGVLDKLYNAWKSLNHPPIISGDTITDMLKSFQQLYQIETLERLSIHQLRDNKQAEQWHQSQPDEIAFLQLSSGSTGVSKCIQETHQAVINHIHAASQFDPYSPDNITLNWLPMDHVVPLLMYHVKDVYLGIKQIQAPPEHVLNCSECWLNYLEHYQVTHTWSPNFGYKRLNDWLKKNPHRLWDLSSIQHFCNAGEQVTLSIIEEFIELTKPFKLSPHAMQPAYGTAEAATVMTICNNYNEKKHAHHIERASLHGNLLRADEASIATTTFIDQGPPLPGTQIRIVNEENQILPERRIGQLQIHGDMVMPGYRNNEKANQSTFSKDGWYNSGDLGFLIDGHLVITGREKEMIVIYGMNHYCADIEGLVSTIAGVVPTYVAACGISTDDSGTEELAIFYVPVRELLRRNIELLDTIKTQVTLLLGVNPTYVIPIAKNDFPKTTSGKIQRAKLVNLMAAGHFDDILNDCDCILNNKNTQPDWFYQSTWRPRQASIIDTHYPTGIYLFFMDEQGLCQQTLQTINAEHHRCIQVRIATQYNKTGNDQFEMDPSNIEHYQLLFAYLTANQVTITHVIHGWNYHPYQAIETLEQLENAQKWAMCNFLLLAKNLIKAHDFDQPVTLHLIVSHTHSIEKNEDIAYQKGAMLGLIRTLSLEAPWLTCRLIDLPMNEAQTIAPWLLQEIKTFPSETEVVYRNSQRFVQRLKKVEFDQPTDNNIPFKARGIYLISGGLGGIGKEVAAYLLENYQARLILIGRTSLSNNQQDPNKNSSLEVFHHLKNLDGEIQYHAVDICNEKQLQNIVHTAEQQWNAELDGIIHLAGIYREGLLREESRESLAEVLKPKAMGAWVLHQLIKNRPEKKLFIHFSSIVSILGSTNFGAYTAANCFLNSFSEFQKTMGIKSFSFAWSTWHETGVSKGFKKIGLTDVLDKMGYKAITPKQGIDALLIGLQHRHTDLIIGLNGVQKNIRQHMDTTCDTSQTLTTFFMTDHPRNACQEMKSLAIHDPFQTNYICDFIRVLEMPLTSNGNIDQSKLITSKGYKNDEDESRHISPETKTEQELSLIWQDTLSINEPSINDSFFKLGGNSLLATVMLSRVREQFSLDISLDKVFKMPTIVLLAKLIDEQKEDKQEFSAIPKLNQPIAPLSSTQQRLWFMYQFAPDNPQYNIPVSIQIEGNIDIELLIKSINTVIQHHDILRTRFKYMDNQIVQETSGNFQLPISIIDLSDITDNQEAHWRKLAHQETTRTFELTRLPLLSIRLYKLATDRYILFTIMHHIISDGWSLGVFFDELISHYKILLTNQTSNLPELPIQYSDYAVWQQQQLSNDKLNSQLNYWKTQLANLIQLNLPTDHPRSYNLPSTGQRQTIQISKSITDAINILSRQQEASLFMTLMSAFMVLCTRYSGQDDIAIGTPIANRHHPETEPMIGFFANTLVMRGNLANNPTFIELLQQIKQTSLNAYKNQDVPFDQLVDAIQPDRKTGQNPLCQVVLALQNTPKPNTDLEGIKFHPYQFEGGLVRFDLELHIFETSNGLDVHFDYDTGLFEKETIERMAGHYRVLLTEITQYANRQINNLSILTNKEKQTLLIDWNKTNTKIPDGCLHHLFEYQAMTNSSNVALVFEKYSLTYQQLNSKANQLAHHLQLLGGCPRMQTFKN